LVHGISCGTAIAAGPACAPGGSDAALEVPLEKFRFYRRQEGKLGWILLWAIGVPIPVLFVLFLLRGCT
jgi:hypothetical protein